MKPEKGFYSGFFGGISRVDMASKGSLDECGSLNLSIEIDARRHDCEYESPPPCKLPRENQAWDGG